MSAGIWESIVIQFGPVTLMVWGCTEFFSPPGKVARRLSAVMWAWVFSLVAYLIGWVTLPDLVTDFDMLVPAWALRTFVVCALGTGSAVLAHLGHEQLPAQRAKRG